MKEIVIVGGGGFGKEVQWIIERINEDSVSANGEPVWDLLGYIDDGLQVGFKINGHEVIGNSADLLSRHEPLAVTCSIGSAAVRRRVIEKLRQNEALYFPNLIDPSLQYSEWNSFGIGNIVYINNVMAPNSSLGDFCIINLDCTIGHDANLGSFVTVYPGVNISGNVTVGEGSELGTGSSIIQGKTIGENAIIGAGSVIINDIPDNCTAVGCPCKPIKFNK